MLTPPTSQITFLYFSDLTKAKEFFSEKLGLKMVSDQGWACIWQSGEKAFIGGVDANRGSIDTKNRGGVLISFNVDNVDMWYAAMKEKGVESLTDIKHFADIGLRSFFFKGPDGYDFEIQEFLDPATKSKF